MKKTLIVLLVLALIVAGFSVAGMAFGGAGNRMDRGQYFRQENRVDGYQCQILDLTEEQQEKLDEVRGDIFEKREELRQQLVEKQDELRTLVVEGEKEDAIIATKEAILSIQEDLLQMRIEHFQEMKEILSAEQLERLQEVSQAENTLKKYGFSGQYRGHMHSRRPGFRRKSD